MRNFRLTIFVFVAVLFGAVIFSLVVFAEGNVLCTGEVSGVSASSNTNAGQTFFDELTSVNLDILGLGIGFAPASETYAACATEIDNVVKPLDGDTVPGPGNDKYLLRGWAWNGNLGFMSYYCDGLSGVGKNEGAVCGTQDYSVSIGADGSAGVGKRQLSGYAWNDAFGYINFSCIDGLDGLENACGPFDYGVVMDSATGDLSGYAFSQAGVYMNYSGVNVTLPGAAAPAATGWCAGKPYVCVEVSPDSADLDYSLAPGVPGAVKLSDGKDNYVIDIYLREADGVTAMNAEKYKLVNFFKSLTFSWEDTMKLEQTSGTVADTGLSIMESPWEKGLGGVIYKPISNFTSGVDVLDLGGGHYQIKGTIRSYVPSSAANLSYTTSLDPPVLFRNELFLFKYIGISDIEPNRLVLDDIRFTLNDKLGNPVIPAGVIYPNGKDGLELTFRPVMELDTLYVNDKEDNVVAYRGIPVNFKIAARVLNSDFFKTTLQPPLLNLYLIYSESETVNNCNSGENVNFQFNFLNDLDGKPVDVPKISGFFENIVGKVIDVQGLASIMPDETKVPCNTAQGPGIYSTIEYVLAHPLLDKVKVIYYSNKLPRLAGDLIANPAATVHGNVYAQSAFTPSSEVEAVQTAGSVNIDIVRDTVDENLEKYVGDFSIASTGYCIINELATLGVKVCPITAYKTFDTDAEKVFYTEGNDVYLDSAGWAGNKVVIVNGGNVYIDNDLYNATGMNGNRLTIVVLRRHGDDFADAGNVYIHPDVQNIQANIVADGSVFSYSGDKATGIDAGSGEPVWSDSGTMIDTLENQLFIQGSVSSRNTIGGADLDTAVAKDYVLLGTGEILPLPLSATDRLRAQAYDLNYLRLFRLGIEVTADGLPIDQKCQKGLTNDNILAIANLEIVLGENGKQCDGINPLYAYNAQSAPDGDLVPPSDPGILADGLDAAEDFGPVYVYYVAPYSKSFVFSKAGALKISN